MIHMSREVQVRGSVRREQEVVVATSASTRRGRPRRQFVKCARIDFNKEATRPRDSSTGWGIIKKSFLMVSNCHYSFSLFMPQPLFSVVSMKSPGDHRRNQKSATASKQQPPLALEAQTDEVVLEVNLEADNLGSEQNSKKVLRSLWKYLRQAFFGVISGSGLSLTNNRVVLK